MKRWVMRASLVLAVLAVIVVVAAVIWLRASLPVLKGEVALDGLDAPVKVERDRVGVATVVAASESDLVRSTGFVHAQERFFQMDLMRRSAAGEMSALVGDAALDFDRSRRLHDLRQVAAAVLDGMATNERELLEVYAEGVNAGVAALGARPFEYGLLRTSPQPWRPEDSLLAVYAMYFDLHDEDARRERNLDALHAVFPEAFVSFLVPSGTRWDAPVKGSAIDPPGIPGPDVIDFREQQASAGAGSLLVDEAALMPGSNSWAVDGARSSSGIPIVANDMHLGLRVPNIWYRMRLEVTGEQGYEVTGVSLPGVPGVIAGSNGEIAWSFTNSYGDWVDLVRLESGDCEQGYLGPEGCEAFERRRHEIKVANDENAILEVLHTRWGPVMEVEENDGQGDGQRRYALRWIAHDPAATNLDLQQLGKARDIDAAIRIAHGSGMPHQNFIVVDRHGEIAWTIIGRIPRRVGHDGQRPLDSANTGAVWEGWLSSEEYPLLRNPEHGRLWSANARMVDGDELAVLGDGGYALGARAAQIRDRLFEQETFDTEDLLRIQLDDEARFLERWQQLLLDVLDHDTVAAVPERQEMRELVERWQGRASVDAVAYRIVREFRDDVFDEVMGGLTAEVQSRFPGFAFSRFAQSEAPLWQLVTQKPAHLLPPGHATWNDLLVQVADDLRETLAAHGSLNEQTWGKRNTTRIDHPLGRLPLVGLFLNAPATELPGDAHMPRVQGRAFGASERFAVSPGQEEHGYFHMPGGQSGHPLSPFHLAAHEDWETGRPSPFLPGDAEFTLRLLPVEGTR